MFNNNKKKIKAQDESTLFYRGFALLEAFLEELRLPKYGLANATDVLLTGN